MWPNEGVTMTWASTDLPAHNNVTVVTPPYINFDNLRGRNVNIGVLGILLNSVTIVTLGLNRKMKQSLQITILSLLMNEVVFTTDLFVVGLPCWVWTSNTPQCWAATIIALASNFVSYFLTGVMALHNYVAVFFPLKCNIMLSARRSVAGVIVCWVCAYVLSLTLIGARLENGLLCLVTVVLPKNAMLGGSVICFIVSGVILVLNIKICVKIWRRSGLIYPETTNDWTGGSKTNCDSSLTSERVSVQMKASASGRITKSGSSGSLKPHQAGDGLDPGTSGVVKDKDVVNGVKLINFDQQQHCKELQHIPNEADSRQDACTVNVEVEKGSNLTGNLTGNILSLFTEPRQPQTRIMGQPCKGLLGQSETSISGQPCMSLLGQPQIYVLKQQQQISNLVQPQIDVMEQTEINKMGQPQASLMGQPETSILKQPQISLSEQPQASTSEQPQISILEQPQAPTINQPNSSLIVFTTLTCAPVLAKTGNNSRQIQVKVRRPRTCITLVIMTFWTCVLTFPLLVNMTYSSLFVTDRLAYTLSGFGLTVSSLVTVHSLSHPLLYAWKFVHWRNLHQKVKGCLHRQRL